MDYLFREPEASFLEGCRRKARRKWNIVYDCLNAYTTQDGFRVLCKKQTLHYANCHAEGIPIRQVLIGHSTKLCKNCSDFRDGTPDDLQAQGGSHCPKAGGKN